MGAIHDAVGFDDIFPSAHAEPCPDCLAPLDLHQPDPQTDDRLLGICLDCKDWYDVDGQGRIRGKLRSIGLKM